MMKREKLARAAYNNGAVVLVSTPHPPPSSSLPTPTHHHLSAATRARVPSITAMPPRAYTAFLPSACSLCIFSCARLLISSFCPAACLMRALVCSSCAHFPSFTFTPPLSLPLPALLCTWDGGITMFVDGRLGHLTYKRTFIALFARAAPPLRAARCAL